MSVIYKVVTRPSDPRVPNSPKKYYPHLITLGQSVNLKYIAQKMQGYSSLSIGDIKSVIQNFVEKMKEQLLEGKSVNIEGLGVFMLTACSKGADAAKDVNAKSVDSVRIFFQANKELRITKTATRAGSDCGWTRLRLDAAHGLHCGRITAVGAVRGTGTAGAAAGATGTTAELAVRLP